MLTNRHNWAALFRVFSVYEKPGRVLRAIASRTPLEDVVVKTPTGPVKLTLRNFESLKTSFSIFCRQDYPTSSAKAVRFLDIGANVGIAAAYFLSRNEGNTIRCYEPDSDNLEYLRKNLAQFGDRAQLVEHAVGPEAGSATLFKSQDGKYTSLLDNNDSAGTDEVTVDAFDSILAEAAKRPGPIVLKIDIEGLEPALVESVNFADYPQVERIIVESLECSQRIARPHQRTVRSGYVEDLVMA